MQIHEARLLKEVFSTKTYWKVFLWKYWLTFAFENSRKCQRRLLEVFSYKHVSFAIGRNLSEIWLFIEDFSGKISLEFFWKSSRSLLNVARSLPGILLQLTIFDISKEDFRWKTSREVFSCNHRFDQPIIKFEKTSKEAKKERGGWVKEGST